MIVVDCLMLFTRDVSVKYSVVQKRLQVRVFTSVQVSILVQLLVCPESAHYCHYCNLSDQSLHCVFLTFLLSEIVPT